MTSIKQPPFIPRVLLLQVRGQSGDPRGGPWQQTSGGLVCEEPIKKTPRRHSDQHPARLASSRFHLHIHERTFSQPHNQKAANRTRAVIAHLVSEREVISRGGIRCNTTSSFTAQGHLAPMAKFSCLIYFLPSFQLASAAGRAEASELRYAHPLQSPRLGGTIPRLPTMRQSHFASPL